MEPKTHGRPVSQNNDASSHQREKTHDDKSWLNDEAKFSIQAMSVAEETSHDDKSWLKDDDPPNMSLVSLTKVTFQFPIF